MTNGQLIDKILTYTMGCLISIAGFFASRSLARIEKQITELNYDVIQLRIDVTKLQATYITEDKVREIVENELKLKGIKR